jgi:hypothetical protein
MKHPLSFISCIGILLSGTSLAASVYLGAYKTEYSSTTGTAAVNQAATYSIDLSDLTGLTPGAPIRIDFTPDDFLVWLGFYTAETGQLEFAWQAEMEISVGGYSATFTEDWAFGPVPFVYDPLTAFYAGWSAGPDPVTRSLVVPWGTDLSNVSFTLRDRSRILAEVSGVFTDSQMTGTGATFVTRSVETPEIGIERSGGLVLEINDNVDFGATVAGQQKSITFTIRNTGASPLILSGTNLASTPPGAFNLATPLSGNVAAGGSLEFTVIFAPTAAGVHNGTFTLLSNDANEGSFLLGFSGNALSFTTDTDVDGLNDASEFNMTALGFDWQVNQSALVNTLFANAAGAGLYTAGQVQAIKSGTPLIARDPETGKFKLTLDWKKSTTLTDFLDFPAPAGSAVSISPQGDVEFEFPSTDAAAFYRIEME